MHWTERQRARVNLAEELRRRGWTLFGYHEDRSDPMTDYYSPASWDGVAEKEGYVVVVDVSKSNNYVLSRSGGRQTQRQVRGGDCAHCQGSGLEPDGWTLEQAKADPREFNRTWTGQGVALLPSVVSPLHFDEQGRQKCTKCNGQGHTWKPEPDVEPWPTFQPNRPKTLWHVEKQGRILAAGVGLGPCADYDSQRAQAAAEQIVCRIEDAIHTRPVSVETDAGTASDMAATIRHNQAHMGSAHIEVAFASKPALEIREALKALGFRWSQRQGLWYTRYTEKTWQQVHALLEQEPTATEELEMPTLPESDAGPPEPEAQVETPGYIVEEPLTGRVIGGNSGLADKPKPEPWQMTRLAYQESRAARVAGGVAILNARDGRDHEAAVRRAVEASLPVPPEVLAEYGLVKADVMEVLDVYDRRCRISRHDYLAGWKQIRLYCDTADKLLSGLPEWHTARKAQGGAITIHRDNIAGVLSGPQCTESDEAASVRVPPSTAAPAAAPTAPVPVPETPLAQGQPGNWTILTSLKWKNGRPVAPRGIIKAHNGDGQIHHLTPWVDGLWCMTCGSEVCPAAAAVLAARPAPKGQEVHAT